MLDEFSAADPIDPRAFVDQMVMVAHVELLRRALWAIT
jgi:hypothetical protein